MPSAEAGTLPRSRGNKSIEVSGRRRYATVRFPRNQSDPPMTQTEATFQQRPFGGTMRRDAWWVQPLVVFLGLGAFVVYSTWAAFQGTHYFSGPYISPFYSPEIFGPSPHSLLGPKPGCVAMGQKSPVNKMAKCKVPKS